MTQVITRQNQWPDGDMVVEVSGGGIDYTNPDALAAKYRGEFEEINDPREAIDTAIKIAKQWQTDHPELQIKIATGSTGGFTMPFVTDDTVRLNAEELAAAVEEYMNSGPNMPKGLLRKWAENAVAKDYPDGWNEPLFAALRKDAAERYEKLPKCDHCGELLPDERHRFKIDGLDDQEFCREYCAEEAWAEQERFNAELEAEEADEEA